MEATLHKLRIAVVATVSIVGSSAAMTGTAEAQYYDGGHHGGHHGGWIGPAIIGGAVLGGLAATSPHGYARRCWIERQQFHDHHGRHVVRRVRVCD